MADIFDLISPVELTTFARLLLADEDMAQNQLQLERWFPLDTQDAIDFEWSAGTTRTYTDAAPFRAFTTPPRIGTRPGRIRKRGKLGPTAMMYPLTESDVIDIRRAEAQGGQASDAVQGDVFDDVAAGIRAIRNRFEILRSSALVNGTASITENGLQLSVDFDRDPANEDTVATAWSSASTATPLADEEAVLDQLQDAQGIGPAELIVMMNRSTFRNWKNTEEIRSVFPSFRELPTISAAQASQVRVDQDYPPIVINDSQLNEIDGTTRKVIPDGIAVYMPSNRPVGDTLFGTSVVATDPAISLERNEQPGPVAYLMRELPEYVIWTVIDALGFVRFTDPDATFALDTEP